MQGKDIENIIKEAYNNNSNNNSNNITLQFLYNLQLKFQKEICSKDSKISYKDDVNTLPIDNANLFQFHCLSLLEEIGELVKSDKRWKNYRNTKYDKGNKLEEISDCFIVLLNICIFSGFSDKEIENAILNKMLNNFDRIYKEKVDANGNNS